MAEVIKGAKQGFVKKTPSYDPDKNYEWQPDDQFVLTGEEFAKLYQLVKTDLHLSGGAPIMQKVKVFEVLESILASAVRAGVAIEQRPPQTGNLPEELQNIEPHPLN